MNKVQLILTQEEIDALMNLLNMVGYDPDAQHIAERIQSQTNN